MPQEWYEIDWAANLNTSENRAWITSRMAFGFETLLEEGKMKEIESIFKNEVATFAAMFKVRVQGIKVRDLGGDRIATEPGGIIQFDNSVLLKPVLERFLKIMEGLKAIRTDPACKFVAHLN